MGYPNAALLCYVRHCSKPALIWLDEVAASAYEHGERHFVLMGSAVRAKVQ